MTAAMLQHMSDAFSGLHLLERYAYALGIGLAHDEELGLSRPVWLAMEFLASIR